MDKLLKHLNEEDHYRLFPHGKYTEATSIVYTALGAAIYEEADTFIVKENYFEWMRDFTVIGRFLGKNAPIPTPTYPKVFKIICAYDEIVMNYIEIDAEIDKTLYVSLLSD